MVARRKRSDFVDEFYGIPVTTHDIKNFTTREERRGYFLIFGSAAVLTFVSLVLWIAGVDTFLDPGLWPTLLLFGASLMLAYAPIAFGRVAREARSERDVVAHLDSQRIDSFWYERGVTDETPERVYEREEERRAPPP